MLVYLIKRHNFGCPPERPPERAIRAGTVPRQNPSEWKFVWADDFVGLGYEWVNRSSLVADTRIASLRERYAFHLPKTECSESCGSPSDRVIRADSMYSLPHLAPHFFPYRNDTPFAFRGRNAQGLAKPVRPGHPGGLRFSRSKFWHFLQALDFKQALI